MKKSIILSLLVLISFQQGAFAASVKAVLDSTASEEQAQNAASDAEAKSGGAANVIRDSVTGKVTEVRITLPENDNAGIERAKEALVQNAGVATVLVEEQPSPVYVATGGMASSNQGQTIPSTGLSSSMLIGITGGIPPYTHAFVPAGISGDNGLKYSANGSWLWFFNGYRYWPATANTTGRDLLEAVKITDSVGNFVSIPFIISN